MITSVIDAGDKFITSDSDNSDINAGDEFIVGDNGTNEQLSQMSLTLVINPLPHGVLATFSLTAGGPIGPPKKDDISW